MRDFITFYNYELGPLHTWNIIGVVAEEKLKLLLMCLSGSYLSI